MSPLATDGGLTIGSHKMTWLFFNEKFSATHVHSRYNPRMVNQR